MHTLYVLLSTFATTPCEREAELTSDSEKRDQTARPGATDSNETKRFHHMGSSEHDFDVDLNVMREQETDAMKA